MSIPYHSFSGPMIPEESKKKNFKKLRNDAIKIVIGSILVAYILISAIKIYKQNRELGRWELEYRELKINHTNNEAEKFLLEQQFKDHNESTKSRILNLMGRFDNRLFEREIKIYQQYAIIHAMNCSTRNKNSESEISPEILIGKIWKPDPSKFENAEIWIQNNSIVNSKNLTEIAFEWELIIFRSEIYLENPIFEIGETPEFQNYTLLKYSSAFPDENILKEVLRIGDVPGDVIVFNNEKTIYSDKRKIIFEKQISAVETERIEFSMKDGFLNIRNFKNGLNMTRVYHYCGI